MTESGAGRASGVDAMLQPKRTKFRKQFKGRIHGLARGGTQLNFGAYGMKALEPGRVTAREIEAARRAITRHLKRVGRVWIRVFPDVPVTQKPAEVRMGKGKGSVEYWVARSSPAASCSRSTACREDLASEAPPRRGQAPVGTRFIKRRRRPRRWRDEGRRGPAQERRRAERAAHLAPQGAVQPALPEGDRASSRVPARVRQVRRDIARVLTILGERAKAEAGS